MSQSRSERKAQRRSLLVDPDGLGITIEYCPAELTPNYLKAFREARASGAVDQAVVDSALKIVKKWDYKDKPDDKHPIPLTEAELFECDLEVFNAIDTAISKDTNVSKKSETTSNSSFAA